MRGSKRKGSSGRPCVGTVGWLRARSAGLGNTPDHQGHGRGPRRLLSGPREEGLLAQHHPSDAHRRPARLRDRRPLEVDLLQPGQRRPATARRQARTGSGAARGHSGPHRAGRQPQAGAGSVHRPCRRHRREARASSAGCDGRRSTSGSERPASIGRSPRTAATRRTSRTISTEPSRCRRRRRRCYVTIERRWRNGRSRVVSAWRATRSCSPRRLTARCRGGRRTSTRRFVGSAAQPGCLTL